MLTEHQDRCPYCGETISLLVDCSDGAQTYIEDCEVCCRPIQVRFSVTEAGELQSVDLFSETDVI
ncbi:CPXCG motif-containing cysteine-rich protein [Exilibacterium tricleocarpae]|uniref:CPXCG motif-containing cysteine-rich protein n=2 Tax=Exilibacterium tricleocarpae TaxID=2591008 RepID=A0A545U5T8_9GAMM|nr:CPXCG motif-containing cysteine-rich protein [Exilibacterium tricleocarpae]TQV84838.1 CPXCG motif-containing cysteine-rich protein [Exilibacterium tricleocarpae]